MRGEWKGRRWMRGRVDEKGVERVEERRREI